jgi:hypothetical protein
MAASIKMAVFWDVASCSLVEAYRRFGGTYSLSHQGVEQAAHSSGMAGSVFIELQPVL